MREVVLLVPRLAVEDVLDRLLPIAPGGVREVDAGRHVELRMRGAELPTPAQLARAAGRWPHKLAEREVADDWRQRRLADYEPDVIGGRLVVRPEWAPAPGKRLIDIVLHDQLAFGAGTHPTTRTCLEMLLGLEPMGSFADLGCGTGVLAIAAATLGWEPVEAVDLRPESVRATLVNADANQVTIAASTADLATEPPPQADGLAANFQTSLHAVVAAALSEPLPRLVLLSGFGVDEAPSVLSAYGARGFREARRAGPHGWAVIIMRRD